MRFLPGTPLDVVQQAESQWLNQGQSMPNIGVQQMPGIGSYPMGGMPPMIGGQYDVFGGLPYMGQQMPGLGSAPMGGQQMPGLGSAPISGQQMPTANLNKINRLLGRQSRLQNRLDTLDINAPNNRATQIQNQLGRIDQRLGNLGYTSQPQPMAQNPNVGPYPMPQQGMMGGMSPYGMFNPFLSGGFNPFGVMY